MQNEYKKKEFSQESSLFSFNEFRKSFKAIGWIIPVIAVVAAIVTLVVSLVTHKPLYRSTVRFTITPLISSDSTNGASVYNFNYNSSLATQMAETFPYIMRSGVLIEMISYDLKRPVNATISSTAVTDTNIFEVYVVSTSAQDAYDVIMLLIENYPKVGEYVVGDTQMNVIEGSEPEICKEPINSRDKYNYVFVAGLIGAFAGVMIVNLYGKFRKTVNSRHDVETKLNGRCICEIPDVKKKRASSNKTILRSGPNTAGFSEAIRVLKQRTRSCLKADDAKVVGITSTTAEEGKTTIAYNLARSLSTAKAKVLLIDMDFRNRTLQQKLNRKKEVPDTGISEVVTGKLPLEDAINTITDTFEVLFVGQESFEYRKSDFVAVFKELREKYDFIVMDMSSCGVVSETISLADLCDQLIFVVKWDTVNYDKISNAVRDLAFSEAKFMGFVLNKVSMDYGDVGSYKYSGYGMRKYGYGYGYGYGKSYGYGRPYGNDGQIQTYLQNQAATEEAEV